MLPWVLAACEDLDNVCSKVRSSYSPAFLLKPNVSQCPASTLSEGKQTEARLLASDLQERSAPEDLKTSSKIHATAGQEIDLV